MTALDVLRTARKRIATGWAQAEEVDQTEGRWCVRTATTVWWAEEADAVLDDALAKAEEADAVLDDTLAEMMGQRTDPVGWNDAPERTREDVLALYDRAIARLESEMMNTR